MVKKKNPFQKPQKKERKDFFIQPIVETREERDRRIRKAFKWAFKAPLDEYLDEKLTKILRCPRLDHKKFRALLNIPDDVRTLDFIKENYNEKIAAYIEKEFIEYKKPVFSWKEYEERQKKKQDERDFERGHGDNRQAAGKFRKAPIRRNKYQAGERAQKSEVDT